MNNIQLKESPGLIHGGNADFNTIKKLHAYSGSSPYKVGTDDENNWLHLSKDKGDLKYNHAELYGDLRYLASEDYDITEYSDLLRLNSEQFVEIRLDWVLDYIEWKNQERFLVAIWNLLQDSGKLSIRTRNLNNVLGSIDKKLKGIKGIIHTPWGEIMQSLYSSTCPKDNFLCCQTKDNLKKVLISSGFGNIIFEKGNDLALTCRKLS